MTAGLWVNLIVGIIAALGGIGLTNIHNARKDKRKVADRLPLHVSELQRSRSALQINCAVLQVYARALVERARIAGVEIPEFPQLEPDPYPPDWLTETMK